LISLDLNGGVNWYKRYPGGGGTGTYTYSSPHLKKLSNDRYIFGSGDCFGGTLLGITDTSGNMLYSISPALALNDFYQTKDTSFFLLGNGPMCGVHPATNTVLDPQIGILKIDSLFTSDTLCFWSNNATTTLDQVSSIVVSSINQQNVGAPARFSVTISLGNPNIIPGCVDFSGNVDEKSYNPVSVYPNPGNGTFTFENKMSGNYNLIVTDIQGKTIFNEHISNSIFNKTISATSGVYFYKCLFDNGNTFTGKLIIATH
jgi:plastocyanin